MGVLEAVRAHPMASFWAVVISSLIIMESYDVFLMNNFVGLEAFRIKYGVPDPAHPNDKSKYLIAAQWQSSLQGESADDAQETCRLMDRSLWTAWRTDWCVPCRTAHISHWIPMGDFTRLDVAQCLHLRFLLRRFYAGLLRCADPRGYSLGVRVIIILGRPLLTSGQHLHRQRAGLVQ